ncbi:MAG TPA: hypothetical protein DHM90_11850 [Clostridiaceae bacterium]|nr:hypothetical protein [Clostridiaceae bacterium]
MGLFQDQIFIGEEDQKMQEHTVERSPSKYTEEKCVVGSFHRLCMVHERETECPDTHGETQIEETAVDSVPGIKIISVHSRIEVDDQSHIEYHR